MNPLTKEEAGTLKCPWGGGTGITTVRCTTSGCMAWEWVEFTPDRSFRPDTAEYNKPKKGICQLIGGDKQ